MFRLVHSRLRQNSGEQINGPLAIAVALLANDFAPA